MRLSHRLLRVSLVALLPAAGLLAGLGTAASASTHPSSHGLSKAALIREISKELNVERHATMQRAPGVHGTTNVNSTNWAGYADLKNGYNNVSANWTEPSAKCGSALSYAVFWVGLDGFSSSTVEQDGTGIQCQNGVATQFTWWEMFPTNSIQVVGTAIRAGDSITASVRRIGTTYTLKVLDHTHPAANLTRTQTCSNCKNSSAEWIAEAPSSSSGVLPLSNFGTWSETNASVTAGTKTGVISTFVNDRITMVNSSGQVKAQPSALFNSGKNFQVIWKRST